MLTDYHKILLCQLVLQRKEIILSKFSPKLTKRMKLDAWTEIADKLREAGASFRDHAELRDVYLGNLKSNTKRKLDRYKANGEGKMEQLTAYEELVIQILEEESGYLNPLKVSEPQIGFAPAASAAKSNRGGGAGQRGDSKEVDCGEPEKPKRTAATTTMTTATKRTAAPKENSELADEMMHLRKRKLEEEVNLLAKQNHLMDLQIRQMEREERNANTNDRIQQLTLWKLEKEKREWEAWHQ